MRICRLFALFCCCLSGPFWAGAAEFDPELTQVVRRIPRSDAELKILYEQTGAAACEAIDEGAPLEVGGFNEPISHRRAAASNDLSRLTVMESSRRGVLSFGMDMLPGDQRELPLLSGGKILEYVDQTYISIQVRIERDSPAGEPLLHFRPVGVQGNFANRRTAESFSAMLRESVAQVHGLGLYLKPDQQPKPENLRTLVALHRSLADDARQAELERQGTKGREMHYELLFVRARIDGRSTERQVTLHAFATTEDRTRLRYLHPYQTPAKAADCSIKSTIYFTSYGFANLYPAAKSTRKIEVNGQASFAMADLDRYTAAQGWDGDALGNVTEILDAIIDGRVR